MNVDEFGHPLSAQKLTELLTQLTAGLLASGHFTRARDRFIEDTCRASNHLLFDRIEKFNKDGKRFTVDEFKVVKVAEALLEQIIDKAEAWAEAESDAYETDPNQSAANVD